MKIELGYACINTHLGGFKSYRLIDLYDIPKTRELRDRIIYNFEHTLKILQWNQLHQIRMYRFTSELVPLATHPEFWRWQQRNNWYWFQDTTIINIMAEIKRYAQKHQHRLSLHPGQYTVVNSNNHNVVSKSILDLEHHYYLMYHLGALGLVIHVGGVYGDKPESMSRWVNEYRLLPQHIQDYLYLENDDKSYTVKDILTLSKETGVKPLVDFHHHRCNPSTDFESDMEKIIPIWENSVKVHLSSGRCQTYNRSHADLVIEEDLDWVINTFQNLDYQGTLWIMLESKDKELSVLNLKGRLKTGEVKQ